MKKRIFALTAFLLAFASGCAAAQAAGSDRSYIDNVRIASDISVAENTVRASFEIEDAYGENVLAALVVTDEDNKVKALKTLNRDLSGAADFSLECAFDRGEGNYRARALLWGDNMQPMMKAVTKDIISRDSEGFVELSDVRLEDGIFKTSRETGLRYILSMDVDRLLAPSFETAKLPTPNGAVRYGGWERKGANNWTASSADTFTLAGHTLGHWMSAAAVMYASTGSEELLERLNYAAEQLSYIQERTGSGYIGGVDESCFKALFAGNTSSWSSGYWVPWYGIHKIYQGLIDVYSYTGNEQALEVVLKFADWAKDGCDKLTDSQMQTMLNVEYGGMNEVFAELYEITGDRDYIETARRFTHDSILTPLENERDNLTGLHANTQIPKIIGAAAIYEADSENYPKYKTAARFFWNSVVNNRSYVTGGNSISEHFEAIGSESLGVKTTESCNTYNMLKLTEHLFSWEHDSSLMDYYETALYNHILGSQDPDTGNKMYFVSLLQGHYRIYGSPFDSFWCCTGTGMENPGRYAKCIYYKDSDQFYVNLYIPSTVKWREKGLTFRQETSYPYSDKIRFTVEEGSAFAAINFRVPSWAENGAEAVVNGTDKYVKKDKGYLSISGSWSAGDVIELTIPMSLSMYVSREGKAAFRYGAVVLAAPLGSENLPNDTVEKETGLDTTTTLVPYLVYEGSDINELISAEDISALRFKINGAYTSTGEDISLIPFYEIHHEFHNVYWNINEEGDIFEKKLNNVTIDSVEPDGQQDEIGHNFTGKNSHNGTFSAASKTYMWRDAWGSDDAYFSYDMAVSPDEANYLCVAYWGSDVPFTNGGVRYTRSFNIYCDNTLVSSQIINNNKPNEVYYRFYEIPQSVTAGKTSVTVKLAANGASCCAGGILEMRTVRETVE